VRFWLNQTIKWVRGAELAVLISLSAIVGGAWIFIELADEVLEQETQTIDEKVLRALRQPDDPAQLRGPEWLQDAGRDITALGSFSVLLLVTLSVVGYLLIRRLYSAMWLVLIATTGGLGLSTLLKWWVSRDRPTIVPHLAEVDSASFPSGHSMLSAVVYLTLGTLIARLMPQWRLRIYVLSVAGATTVLVGVSRMLMGVHYPTDVLAGWTAGLVWASLCWVVARHLQRRGAVEKDVADGS
jgi:undecaprenyl-diphosphatase